MSEVQIPHGSTKLYCPLWRKKMSTVCHTCPWWQTVSGTDANGKPVNEWRCALAWMTTLHLENAKVNNATNEILETCRKESTKAADITHKMVATVICQNQAQSLAPPVPLQEIKDGDSN